MTSLLLKRLREARSLIADDRLAYVRGHALNLYESDADAVAGRPRFGHEWERRELRQYDAAIETVNLALAEIKRLRDLAGCAYQFAGAHNAPAKWLDALSDASDGTPFTTAGLLPYSPKTLTAAPSHTPGESSVPLGSGRRVRKPGKKSKGGKHGSE